MKAFLTLDTTEYENREKLSEAIDSIASMTKAFDELQIEYQTRITNLPPRARFNIDEAFQPLSKRD